MCISEGLVIFRWGDISTLLNWLSCRSWAQGLLHTILQFNWEGGEEEEETLVVVGEMDGRSSWRCYLVLRPAEPLTDQLVYRLLPALERTRSTNTVCACLRPRETRDNWQVSVPLRRRLSRVFPHSNNATTTIIRVSMADYHYWRAVKGISFIQVSTSLCCFFSSEKENDRKRVWE